MQYIPKDHKIHIAYLVIVAIVVMFFTSVIARFFVTHKVIVRSPIVIKRLYLTDKQPVIKQVKAKEVDPTPTVKPSKVKTEKEIVLAQKHGAHLWKIYQLETQRGLTDSCRINGTGFGGFGVMDDQHKVVCYPSFEIAAQRASYWLGKLNPQGNLVNALCVWNLGGANAPYVNCRYYQDYLTVI